MMVTAATPQATSTDQDPWPGPRPYREADRQRFFGRDEETYDLLERLDAERLVLLTAPSAVGKTSFLRAAVVPELRQRRRMALEADQPTLHPAVIVVRDWGLPDALDPDDFFIAAIRKAVENLETERKSYTGPDAEPIRRDYKTLSAVKADTNAYTYVVNLAIAAGGLILIFDQFEEALQGSSVHITKASQLMARLYNRAPNVHLLLSFREEFMTRFNVIGKSVGDLTKRTYYLRPMEGETLRDVLLQSARAGDVDLTEEAVDELLHWIELVNVKESRAPIAGDRSSKAQRATPYVQRRDMSVDLLKLQALLLQLYRMSAANGSRNGQAVIDRGVLDELRRDVENTGEEADGHEIIERALQRFIDGLLPLPPGFTDQFGVPLAFKMTDEAERMLRMRRAAARMGPSFSSGGFKVQQEQAALLARTWREEWEVIGLDVNDVDEELGDAGDLTDPAVRGALFSVAKGTILEETMYDALAPEDISTLSGVAKRGTWSIRATAVDLIAVSLEALDLLREGNVLRRKSLHDGEVTYELVHDGFGDAIFDWSEETRAQPLDALAATTAERGTAFRWSKLSGIIKDVAWLGCWVGPDAVDGTKRLSVEDAVFEDCDLRGTVFDRCDFRRGSFKNCNLGGTVFWDCEFDGNPDAPWTFDGITASGLNFDDNSKLRWVRFSETSRLHNMSWDRLTVENVLFDGCVINQMTVGEVTLDGELTFRDSWLLLSDLVSLCTGDSAHSSMLHIDGCDLFYCRLDNDSSDAVHRGQHNILYPDPDKMGAEPALRNINVDAWERPG